MGHPAGVAENYYRRGKSPHIWIPEETEVKCCECGSSVESKGEMHKIVGLF